MASVCANCGFNDADYGCTCISSDKWYACPIENKKPENIQALKEYGECVQQFYNKIMEVLRNETS